MENAYDQINKDLFVSGFADEIADDFDIQLQSFQRLGIQYISLRGINGKNIGNYTLEEVQEKVVPKLSKYHMKISSIGSPIGKIYLEDEEAFLKQKVMLEELCKIANLLSCRYIRIFSFYPKEGSDFDPVKDQVVEKLKIFVDIAKRYDVILLHENEKDIFGDTARRCRYLLDEIASPYFKAIFDPANFVQMKEDPIACFTCLKDEVIYIHIKDACYSDDQNVVCGAGDGKIKEVIEMALQNGYKGFLTLEPHLVLFDSLKNLELKDVHDVIKEDKGLAPFTAYDIQYRALLEILKTIGGHYEEG